MFEANHYLELGSLHFYWTLGCRMFTRDLLVSQLNLYYRNVSWSNLIINKMITQLEQHDRIKSFILGNDNLLERSDMIQNIQKSVDSLTETIIRWVENHEIGRIQV